MKHNQQFKTDYKEKISKMTNEELRKEYEKLRFTNEYKNNEYEIIEMIRTVIWEMLNFKQKK